MKRIFLLILAALLLLTACAAPSDDAANTTPPAATTVTTTVDRDTITNPNLSELQIELRKAVWTTVKDTVDESLTINNLMVGSFVVQCDDAFVCFYHGCKSDRVITDSLMMSDETVEGYYFRYKSLTKLTVFADGKSYSLQGAYSAGVISEDELRTIWETYKAEYPGLYESDEW